MVDRETIIRGAKMELARREFFFYCSLKAPDFYKEDRKYLVDLCSEFQDFIQSDDEVMIVNEPPRHGKSRTAGLLVEWVLGNDQTQKIMTGSYNETLSTMFSKNVRNDIQEEKADENRIVFSDIFPGVSIKRGDGAMNLWSLEGGYNNYLATSPTGTATGFGASLLIIDDLIKNAEEANNELTKEKHWTWFTDTMLSRLEEGGKIIIIMTRWASDDLAGRALEHFKEAGAKVRHISMKALQNPYTHEMLCPEVLSYKSYQAKIRAMGADIASANYQQEPIDLKGRLYTSFKTYSGELPQFKEIRNYTDTADTGGDYLCSINYGVTFANEAYVLDVLYTKEPMEVTEPATAKMLQAGGVNLARIESNNGGRGFARNVRRILEQELGSNYTTIKWFTQTQNKQARIYSNSAWVMQHIYFPEDWKNRWLEYHNAMIKYQREGQNKHDDAPDATTGIAENCARKGGISVLK
ncbi:phage terminase large subunit [Lachnoclostridium pacaense]|jgi:predicted phage terminase large subunit-like protein|uniref:phage terminase large subunit n=1 Tax=Enterocloster TaxID=2719313 RepID=UPI001D06ACDD|nr:phage terminase large subunit [Lachnoclostridium pacaense]MCB7336498.1 phage terminase large subunit [Enterocloster aldenensis]MCC2879940.1 phage terminase large subunit [Lachnoclostridium pacaense]DAQ87555.1 MAG TPA: Terminase [Caudoviricetes sp.]